MPRLIAQILKMNSKALVILVGCLMLTQVVFGQGGYTLSINPTSGNPGTTVTLTTNPSYADERCFANGQQFAGKTYTVPSGPETINFHCEAGTGEFHVTTNTVSFDVTYPDSDGDGIPDNIDQCPNQPGPPPTGCPPSPTPPPGSTPVPPGEPSPTPVPPEATPITPTRIPLPALPNDGTCYVATLGQLSVNVRARPTTESDIMATLHPARVYPAFFRFDDGENIWFWVTEFEGWVVDYVTRQTEACQSNPFGTEEGELDTSGIQLLDGHLDDALADCPDLIEQLEMLPNFAQNFVADSADPCAEALRILESFLFGERQTVDTSEFTEEEVTQFLQECPAKFVNFMDQLQWLQRAPITHDNRLAAIRANGCDTQLFDGVGPQWVLDTLAGDGYLLIARCNFPYARVNNSMASLYWAYPKDEPPFVNYTEIYPIEHVLLGALFTNGAQPCAYAERIESLGSLSDAQREYITVRHDLCLGPYQPFLVDELVFARRALIDLPTLLEETRERQSILCMQESPFVFEDESLNSPSRWNIIRDAMEMPNGMQDCPDIAARLREWRGGPDRLGIDLIDLISIMLSRNPCAMAEQFLDTGVTPLGTPAWVMSRNDCVSINIGSGGRPTLIVQTGENGVIDQSSSWHLKMAVVNLLQSGYSLCRSAEQTSFPIVVENHVENERVCHQVSTAFRVDMYDPVFSLVPNQHIDFILIMFYRATRIAVTNPDRIDVIGSGTYHLAYYDYLVPVSDENNNLYAANFISSVLGSVEFSLPGWYVIEPVEDSTLCDNHLSPQVTVMLDRDVDSETGGLVMGLTKFEDSSTSSTSSGSGGDSGGSGGSSAGSDQTISLLDINFVLNLDEINLPLDLIIESLQEDPIDLLDFFTNTCGIPWEPEGQFVVEAWAVDNLLPALLEAIRLYPDTICANAQYLLDRIEPNADGELDVDEIRPAEPDDTDLSEVDPRAEYRELLERLDAEELTTAEQALRDYVEACGIPWLPDGRALLIHMLGAGTDLNQVVSEFRANPSGCTLVLRLVGFLDTNEDDLVVRRSVTEAELVEVMDLAGMDSTEISTSANNEGGAAPDDDSASNGGSPASNDGTTPPSQIALPEGQAILQLEQNGVNHLFMLGLDGNLINLSEDFKFATLAPALSPDGTQVAFIGEDSEQTPRLYILDIGLDRVLISLNVYPYRVENVTSAWLPNGEQLLVTLTDATGSTNIYLLSLESGMMDLVAENASQPTVEQNGQIVAFVRLDNGIPNIYSVSLEGGPVRGITAQTEGDGCFNPAFGHEQFVLYLQCADAIYRYDVTGLNRIVEAEVQDFAVGPVPGILLTSDGPTLYIVEESSGVAQPIGQLNGVIGGFSWGR